mgnify:FL=1
MGASTDHALGRNLRFFVKEEAAAGGAYGTSGQEALAGANAAKVLSASMEFTVARNDRTDSRTSRSVLERITGKQEVSWSCESYLLPRGTKEPPNASPLIQAALGRGPTTTTAIQATITAATQASSAVITFGGGHSFQVNDQVYFENVVGMTQLNGNQYKVTVVSTNDVTFDVNSSSFGAWGAGGSNHGSLLSFTLSDSNALPTVHMMRTANDVLREDLFGCYVEDMNITASGGEEPKISFSGGAFNYALTGSGATEGTGSSATSLITESGQGVNFMVGSVISFNSLADKIVTAKSTDTLTIASSSWSDAQAITPTTYTETTAGNPENGISGSLVLNSVTLPVTSFDVTVTNGLKALSDEAFEKGTSDFVAGYRSVKGNISVRARKDFIKSLTQRYVQTTATADPTFSSVALVVTMGGVSGKKVVATLSKIELDFAGIDVPEAEEAILSLPFTALGTSGSDELTLAWNQ